MAIGVAAVAASLFTFLGSATAKYFFNKVLLMMALKAILTTLFVVILPIVINNFIGDMLQGAISELGAIGTGQAGAPASFSGFLGWLLDVFCVPEVLAITIGALQLHITLKMLPFTPVRK